MKNSKFQEAYNKIIAEQNVYIISESFLDQLGGAILKPVVGLGKAGVALAKGDMKQVGEGLKDIATSPVDLVQAAVDAPIQLVKGSVDVVKNQLDEHPNVEKKIDEVAKKLTQDQINKFIQTKKDLPQLKSLLEAHKANKITDDEYRKKISEIIVTTGFSFDAQKTVNNNPAEATPETKNSANKQKQLDELKSKLSAVTTDLNDGDYEISL